MARVIVIDPDGSMRQENASKLEDYQRLVGGYIEAIGLTDTLSAFVNEEGLIDDLPYNPIGHAIVKSLSPETLCHLVGPIVFIGPTDDEGETTSVIDSDVVLLEAMVKMLRTRRSSGMVVELQVRR